MSESILVDFSYPFQNEVPTKAPKSRNGIVVRWGDHDEFVPDSEEDDCLTDVQGATP